MWIMVPFIDCKHVRGIPVYWKVRKACYKLYLVKKITTKCKIENILYFYDQMQWTIKFCSKHNKLWKTQISTVSFLNFIFIYLFTVIITKKLAAT